jgi:hypothetical protein
MAKLEFLGWSIMLINPTRSAPRNYRHLWRSYVAKFYRLGQRTRRTKKTNPSSIKLLWWSLRTTSKVVVWDQDVFCKQSDELDDKRSIPVHGKEISLLRRHCVQTRFKPSWDLHPIRTMVSFPVIKSPSKSSLHTSIWCLNLECVDVRLHATMRLQNTLIR